jgi:hypothetical protein
MQWSQLVKQMRAEGYIVDWSIIDVENMEIDQKLTEDELCTACGGKVLYVPFGNKVSYRATGHCKVCGAAFEF